MFYPGIDTVGSINEDAALDPKKMRLEEAATKAQAAFRGYLVCNSFYWILYWLKHFTDETVCVL